LLDAENATQICEFEQANGRGDYDRSERAAGQILQKVGCEQQKEPDPACANHSGELRLRASSFGDWCAGRAAADRESLKKASGEIGSSQADHLLIWIDRRAHLGGVRPRQDARVGERYHRDSTATDNDVVQVSKTNHRQRKRRESLR
jgi:hypothetical protein